MIGPMMFTNKRQIQGSFSDPVTSFRKMLTRAVRKSTSCTKRMGVRSRIKFMLKKLVSKFIVLLLSVYQKTICIIYHNSNDANCQDIVSRHGKAPFVPKRARRT